MNKNIANTNDKNQLHGYNEWCYDGELLLRTNFKNGNIIGYLEEHNAKLTIYKIK